MTFLVGLAAQVGEWILSKLFALAAKDYAAWQSQRAQAAQAKAEAAALVAAKTAQEVEDAAKASLNGL